MVGEAAGVPGRCRVVAGQVAAAPPAGANGSPEHMVYKDASSRRVMSSMACGVARGMA